MKRRAGVLMLLAAVGGLGSPAANAGSYMSQAWNGPKDGPQWGPRLPQTAANLVGPYGQPVIATAPSRVSQPSGADLARAMLLQQYPPHLLQQTGVLPVGGFQPPPVQPLAHPGPPGAVAAVGALTGQVSPFAARRTEVRFVGPPGMRIAWYAPRSDGQPGFTTQYLEAPARYNFLQAAIYRLKLSNIPGRDGLHLYPTLEVPPADIKTATFLAHSAVPISFSDEDWEQVTAGNFVVKVIYLPDPQFQDLAATGPDEVVSSRLEPGVDPIVEARRRGSILAIVRLGNIDLEATGTPAMDAPDPNQMRRMHGMPPGMPHGAMPPGMLPGAPAMPARGGAMPAAPTVPTPLRPGATPAATPLGRLPASGPVQPVRYAPRPGR